MLINRVELQLWHPGDVHSGQLHELSSVFVSVSDLSIVILLPDVVLLAGNTKEIVGRE